jgi:lactate dehydrogenase-like 2-hydroxyacid dehydrogenase
MNANSPTIVQIGPLSDRINQELSSRHPVLQLWKQADRAAALAAHADTLRIAVTSATHGCSVDTIEALPGLQAVCSWGVGYEKLDIEAARARGVQVSNTPDVLNDCVADLAWALILATARRVGQAERYVRASRWGGTHDGTFPLGARVSGKRLGILGLGRIGAAIARRGAGFDMDIRYHNRTPRPESAWHYEPSLTALAEWADFLVVACVGGPTTHHLVGAEVIRALGAKGTLVNISRGPVVDEQALVQALQEGALGAAGLDVFEQEPYVPPALLEMDNVILMPHQGSATVETRRAMEDLVLQNLDAFLRTGRVLTPVWE